MTKAQLNLKPKHTLVFMATIKKLYKGGKKAAEKKSKPDLVNALYKAYKHKKVAAIGKHKKPVKKIGYSRGKKMKTEYVDISLNWVQTMNGLIMVLEHGNETGKNQAREELMSLARKLDKMNK